MRIMGIKGRCSIIVLVHSVGRLAWSRGDVNESLVADECGNMGLLLQQFYKHCNCLPLGFGMAGEAFESGQSRWASGEELLMQIRFLSSQNQQQPPPELQALYFKTVVYFPLEKGAGVLEIGTKDLVPRSQSSMIYQTLGFMINGIATQDTSRGDQIISSYVEAGIKALPHDAGNQYGDQNEQYKSASKMEIYKGRPISRHPSITSPYWSSTSTMSSSTPSASDQMGNNNNTTFALNTSPAQVSSVNTEDMLLVSPASSSVQATPIDGLHIPNQLDQIDMHGVSMNISLPDLDSYGLNDADLYHISQGYHLHFFDLPLNFSSTNVPASPPLLSLPDNSRYVDPLSTETNAHHNHLLDCVLQPVECAFSARHDALDDAHHCLNEVVGNPSKESNMACQTDIDTLPSVACQNSSHSASYSNDQQQLWRYISNMNDQQQQWRYISPIMNEAGERMTDLFGQSERHAHAMVSAEISNAENSRGDGRLDANVDHEIMQGQGAALMIEDEGSRTSRNRGLIMRVFSTNSEGYEAITGHKMSNDQLGEKYMVGSTQPVKSDQTQGAGSYVSYACGSAEADKVVGPSARIKAAGSFVSAANGNSAEAYKAVGFSTDQGSYVGYASGSAEAEKVDVASSSYGRGPVQEMSPSQVHHMHAERKRRREQSDCINTLRTLLPNITKKNKVAILESTIQHLKELKDRECKLEQENSALMNLSFKNQRNTFKDSSQNIDSQENAMCYYEEGTMPHFQLNLTKNVEDVKDVNATMIEIMNALQTENLYCYELNSEFWKDTNKLSFKILANYKGGEHHAPTLDEIQHIKLWWKQR